MRLKECNPSRLPRAERAIARLARIARRDAVYGGADASVYAKRLAAMGSTTDYDAVVSAAYTSPTGSARDYLAFECPECGSAYLGEDSAAQCCALADEDD